MAALNPHSLLPHDGFTGVVAAVLDNNPGMPQATAERIVVDGPAFVATAARVPGEPMAPSRIVDEGRHALVLHTAVYARPCERLGAFVHHFPERPDATRLTPGVLDRTVHLMRATGYRPDPELWVLPTEGRIPDVHFDRSELAMIAAPPGRQRAGRPSRSP